MEFILIYCTVPKRKDAENIAKELIKVKLAACVNIIDNVKSIFSWNHKITEEKEAMMIIKTRKEFFEKIRLIIKDMHPYSVPEITSVDIKQADETYLEWITYETT